MQHSEDLKDSFIHGTPKIPLQIYNQVYRFGGLAVPYHWHKEIELIYVEEGSMEMTINTETYQVFAGEFFCINSQELHQIYSIGNQSSIHHALVFSPDILRFDCWDEAQEQYINPLLCNYYLLPQKVHTKESYAQEIVGIFKKILFGYQKKLPGWYLSIKGYIYQILGIFAREKLFTAVTKDLLGHNRKVERAKNALSYIHSHYTEKIYLAELAQVMQMNPQYFCRFFKNIFQKTPIEYINHYRITQAVKLIQEKELSILEVCLCCGFENPSYFIRLFREQIGMTPDEYKRILRGSQKKS